MNYEEPADQKVWGIIGLGFTLVVLIGAIDYLTGAYFSFSIFYLIPIYIVSRRGGLYAGIFISICGAIAWLAADLMGDLKYPNRLIPFWNAFVRLSIFLVVAYLVCKLQESYQTERNLARKDSLTGALNGRYFSEIAEKEIERVRRYDRPLTIAYFDIDNFKGINDKFGHSTGDDLLRSVAEVARKNIRSIDFVARLGGDEFAILMPETGYESATVALVKLKNLLQDAMNNNRWPVTFSIGAVTYLKPPGSIDDAIEKADHLMYSAKNGGKNIIKQDVIGE